LPHAFTSLGRCRWGSLGSRGDPQNTSTWTPTNRSSLCRSGIPCRTATTKRLGAPGCSGDRSATGTADGRQTRPHMLDVGAKLLADFCGRVDRMIKSPVCARYSEDPHGQRFWQARQSRPLYGVNGPPGAVHARRSPLIGSIHATPSRTKLCWSSVTGQAHADG
jgi:hypothetical protein